MNRMIKVCLIPAIFLSVVLASGSISFAADAGACSEDVGKFCRDIKPGGGAIADCLKQHHDDLSAPCKDHIAKMEQRREQMRELRRACRQDSAKFCRDVRSGGGRIIKCLMEHENELSAPCSESMKAIQGKM